MTEHSKVLLLSSSTVYGSGYLDHAEVEIRSFLGQVRRVLFVPFALHDRDAYAARARERFARFGCQVESLHEVPDRGEAIRGAEAMFIGGGNTFRLLKCLHRYNLLGVIRTRVMEGMPYLAASAGSNVAGLTIRTTNDMPIVQPPSFDALGLVPFQINPHYVDADPASTHMGETREERILQFHEETTRLCSACAKQPCCAEQAAFTPSAALRAHESSGGASRPSKWSRIRFSSCDWPPEFLNLLSTGGRMAIQRKLLCPSQSESPPDPRHG